MGVVHLQTCKGVEKSAAGAGDVTVKTSSGKLYGLRAVGADVTVKDGTDAVWFVPAGGSDFPPHPIECNTNITLTFSAAGSAYVAYR